MSAFSESLNEDLFDNYFNDEEFGDAVVLIRGSERISMRGLYDTMVVENDPSADLPAISHRPRLMVRKVDLPGQVARKGDVFELVQKNGVHKTLRLKAVEFADESYGVVTYQLEETK
jgi:hypothetical protein